MGGFFGLNKPAVSARQIIGNALAKSGFIGSEPAPVAGGLWTARTSGTATTLNFVAYVNGHFVYGGPSPAPFGTSLDGITWATSSIGALITVSAVAFGAGLYVAAGQDNVGVWRIYSSPDLVTWTQRFTSSPTAQQPPVGLVFSNIGGGQFLATLPFPTSSGVNYYTSPDGITWTGQNTYNNQGWGIGSLYDGTRYFVESSDLVHGFSVATSTDGINFTAQALNHITSSTGALTGVARIGSTYLAIGYNDVAGHSLIESATVLSPWNGVGHDLLWGTGAAVPEGCCASPSLFMVVGDNNNASSSPDGAVWTHENPQMGADSPLAVAFGGGRFVAVGTSGKLSTRG